jgi:hypothetical protein
VRKSVPTIASVRAFAAVVSLGLLATGCSSASSTSGSNASSGPVSAACTAGQKANPSVVGKHYTVGSPPLERTLYPTVTRIVDAAHKTIR